MPNLIASFLCVWFILLEGLLFSECKWTVSESGAERRWGVTRGVEGEGAAVGIYYGREK